MVLHFPRYKRLCAGALLAMLLLAIIVSLPWQSIAENKIKRLLEAQGLRDVQLTLSHIGLNSISLKEIRTGHEPPLLLKDVTLNYSMLDLITGNVRELLLSGVDVNVNQVNNSWEISGLGNAQTVPTGTPQASFPVADHEVAQIPFENVRLNDGKLRIATPEWQMDMPLQISWQKAVATKLSSTVKDVVLKAGAIKAEVGTGGAALSLNSAKKQWEGPWNLSAVKITGAGAEIPELEGDGKIVVQADNVLVEGGFASADRTYALTFTMNYFLNAADKSGLRIIEASMPWLGGSLGAQQVMIPFGGQKPLTINLNLKHVSVQALLEQLTSKPIKASGAISGTLPVTIEKNGNLTFHQGSLKADGAGEIALPADAIPGDNPQVAFVREVLKNLQYAQLSISVNNDKDNRLSILMAIEGRNPDVLSGRAVKLNVHLTGNMVDFIQQNILWLSDPKKLMERGEHEIK